MKKLQLENQRFGRLTVVEEVKSRGKHRLWLCKCECSNTKIVYQTHLISGNSQSCGCLQKEIVSELSRERATTHNMYGTKIYAVWNNIKMRCNNPHNENYKYYGERGIRVCDGWREFEPFKEWAFNNGYKDGLTIERIDVNGNYEPSNCRWATVKEQMNNKRNNHFITHKGKTQTIAQWAEELGISRHTIDTRLSRGWSEERALGYEC